MKTIEIVTTEKGWHVTRRYCGQNQGTAFFFSVAPDKLTKAKDRKAFLADNAERKEKFIKEWMGE